MIRKVFARGYKLMIALVCLAFLFCALASVVLDCFGNNVELKRAVFISVGALVCTALLITIYRRLGQCSERKLLWLSFALLIMFAVGLFIFGFALQTIPLSDLRFVYTEAVNLLETGSLSNREYFLAYENNHAILMLIYSFYRLLSLLGISAYGSASVVLNIGCLILSAWLCRCIGCLRSHRDGLFLMLLFIATPSWYLYSSVYYTDVLCLPFLLYGLLLSLKALRAESTAKRVGLFFASGLVLFCGTAIRTTVAVLIVAVLIALLFERKWRPAVLAAASLSFGVLVGAVLFQAAKPPDLQRDDSLRVPVTHWIMMGLNVDSDGVWSRSDTTLTFAAGDYEEKIAANIEVIDERLSKLGFSGVAKLYLKKTAMVWTDGTNGFQTPGEFGDFSWHSYGKLYEYTLGSKNSLFAWTCQSIRCGLFLLALYSALAELLRKKPSCPSVYIAIFGAFLFYLVWEAKPRYSLSLLPLIMASAEQGMAGLERLTHIRRVDVTLDSSAHAVLDRAGILRLVQLYTAALLVLTLLLGTVLFGTFAKSVSEQAETNVHLFRNGMTTSIDESGIHQSFTTGRPFNRVSIRMQNPNGLSDQEYSFELRDAQGLLLHTERFSSDRIKNGTTIAFNLPYQDPHTEQQYDIFICAETEYPSYLLVNVTRGLFLSGYTVGYDHYPGGEMSGADSTSGMDDISFLVLNAYKGPNMSVSAYCGQFCIFILLAAIPFLSVCRIRRRLKKGSSAASA